MKRQKWVIEWQKLGTNGPISRENYLASFGC